MTISVISRRTTEFSSFRRAFPPEVRPEEELRARDEDEVCDEPLFEELLREEEPFADALFEVLFDVLFEVLFEEPLRDEEFFEEVPFLPEEPVPVFLFPVEDPAICYLISGNLRRQRLSCAAMPCITM